MHIETDVLVVGGGSTGTGVARDLALRGLRVVLVERDDIAAGTSGRNHGLLHSGGRYAVRDPDAAAECIAENRILRRIARHCIWDAGGLFILLKQDDSIYADELCSACKRLDIDAEEIDGDEARRREPQLSADAVRAICVPDAMIDPFSLCLANAIDAAEHGATMLMHHQIEAIEVEGQAKVRRVMLRHRLQGRQVSVEPRLVINAAGGWSGQVAELAGLHLDLILSKGSLLVTSNRLVGAVVNRCRPPGSGDILVPGGPVTLLGTTSVSVQDPSDRSTSPEEVRLLRREAACLVPAAAKVRVLRSFAGVRPLYQEGAGSDDGRAVTRGHAVIDHSQRDGLQGLISIVGGKLTTYRKMAQDVVDLACRHLDVDAPCRTAELPLPGSEQGAEDKPALSVSQRTLRMARIRHGERAEKMLVDGACDDGGRLGHICLCEHVTEAEVRQSVSRLWASTVDDVRRRTRVGCGPCQGTYCGPRVASVVAEELGATCAEEADLMTSFDKERRRGRAPSLEGAQLVQEALLQAVRRAAGTGVEGNDDAS